MQLVRRAPDCTSEKVVRLAGSAAKPSFALADLAKLSEVVTVVQEPSLLVVRLTVLTEVHS